MFKQLKTTQSHSVLEVATIFRSTELKMMMMISFYRYLLDTLFFILSTECARTENKTFQSYRTYRMSPRTYRKQDTHPKKPLTSFRSSNCSPRFATFIHCPSLQISPACTQKDIRSARTYRFSRIDPDKRRTPPRLLFRVDAVSNYAQNKELAFRQAFTVALGVMHANGAVRRMGGFPWGYEGGRG